MKNIQRKFYSMAIVGALLGVFSASSYAGTVSYDITIPCNKDLPAPWILFRGNPKLQYILTTKGMKVPGKTELVTNWDEYLLEDETAPNTGANVIAVCGGSYDKSNWVHMMSSPNGDAAGTKVTCAKGQSISVSLLTPNGQNGEYAYVGTLTKITDDEEEPKIKIPSIDQIKVSDKNLLQKHKAPVLPFMIHGSGT